MPRGGKRKGSGRKHDPNKKKSYATKLKPETIKYLREHKKPAAQIIEIGVELYKTWAD